MASNQPSLSDFLNDQSDENGELVFRSSLYYDLDELCQLLCQENSKKYLSVMNTNARSLVKHTDDYKVLLEYVNQNANFNFDVISFCETWLNDSLEDLVTMENYSSVFKHKVPNKEGGGLGFFVRSDLSFEVRDDFFVPNEYRALFDCLFIEIQTGSSFTNTLVGNFYRSPGAPSEQIFTEVLSSLLDKALGENKQLIILGDMNIDLLKINIHKSSNDYLDSIISNGLIPAITLPTRVTHFSSTLIDHIFIKHSSPQYISGTITTDITDHFTNFILTPNTPLKHKKLKHVTYRKFTPNRILSLQQSLVNFDWSSVTSCEDVDLSYDKFIAIYKEKLDYHIPIKTARFNKYKHKNEPWVSKGILISTKTKDRLFKIFRNMSDPTSKATAHDKYKTYRNLLNRLIKKAKFLYWHGVFMEYRQNMKKTWDHINEIISKKSNKMSFPDKFHYNNATLSNPKDIANGFNHFYINIGQTLCQNMAPNTNDHRRYLANHGKNLNFFMYPTCEQEVQSVLNNMKPKLSSGHDALSPKLIKDTCHGTLKPITHVINLSMKYGIVPTKMKLAKVIPVFKAGETSHIENYRPISLLPVISKVLEKIVYSRLYKYVMKHNILTPAQYGFQENLSTDLAILELQDRVSKYMASGSWCLGVFLDLSKAFDTINHSILISKLEHYGIRGIALNWFRNYLSGRKQYTCAKNTDSDVYSIVCGVPQGSILGPLLFLLYVNDIQSVTQQGHPILFADDTNIIYSHKQLATLCTLANSELDSISNWFIANKLTVNIDKTKYILFHPPNKTDLSNVIQIEINGQALERVQTIKFLGVILQENLNWKPHLEFKANKIAKVTGVLNRLKHQLPGHILLTLYNSLILPHIQYAIAVWGNSPQQHLKRIEILQKKAVRCISRSRYNSHTNPIFLNLRLLKIKDLYKSACCKLYYRKKKGILHKYHSQQLRCNLHQINTRQSDQLYIPRISKVIEKQQISYKIGNEWNGLPSHMQTYYKSPNSFSKVLKALLIQDYDIPCSVANCYVCQQR